MFKTIFLFLASMSLSLSLNASTKDVHYADYIACYYDLQNVQAEVAINPKIVIYMPQHIQKALDTDVDMYTKFQFYTFSPEGFYGATSNGIEDKYCGCEPIENFSCAYNFNLTVDSSKYTLCYSRKWTSTVTLDGEAICSENVLGVDCNDPSLFIDNIRPKNPLLAGKQLLWNINSEELDPSAFWKILYPDLQQMFKDLKDNFMSDDGGSYRFSNGKFPKDANEMINDSSYFPACKKIGKNIII